MGERLTAERLAEIRACCESRVFGGDAVEFVDDLLGEVDALTAELRVVVAANGQLRQALEFYADEDNFFQNYEDETSCLIVCPALKDDGERAREALMDMVETVSPAPRLEMFARRQRLGWDTWGNEALNHVTLASSGSSS